MCNLLEALDFLLRKTQVLFSCNSLNVDIILYYVCPIRMRRIVIVLAQADNDDPINAHQSVEGRKAESDP